MNYQALVESVVTTARALGISQNTLSGIIGVTRQALNAWRNGTSEPKFERVSRLITTNQALQEAANDARVAALIRHSPNWTQIEEIVRVTANKATRDRRP